MVLKERGDLDEGVSTSHAEVLALTMDVVSRRVPSRLPKI